MRLKDTREAYYTNTGKVGDVGRQLALGGIAVVWLLHGPSNSLEFPRALLISLGAFFGFLSCDFLQYFGASLVWGPLQLWKELMFQKRNINPENGGAGEFDVPYITNLWGNAMYLAKSGFLILGGVKLGLYILDKVTMS